MRKQKRRNRDGTKQKGAKKTRFFARDIELDIEKCKWIKEIDCRNCPNKFKEIHSRVFECINATTLRCHIQDLTYLSPSIDRLTNLKELHLYQNNLTSLPDEIGQLLLLVTLDLSSNSLESLPTGIGSLFSLRLLNLNDNELTLDV